MFLFKRLFDDNIIWWFLAIENIPVTINGLSDNTRLKFGFKQKVLCRQRKIHRLFAYTNMTVYCSFMYDSFFYLVF